MDAAQPAIAIRATDLTRRYGDLVAVDHLSLDVRRGEILGFLGPNGAGKTTTIRMICGLLRPDSGRVEIDGVPVAPGRPGRPGAIGLSPQAIAIWDMLTVLEQLEFAGCAYGLSRAAARARAGALLEVFGLEEKRHRLGRTLSGGLQRRLNIALAFVHDPPIVLLDEPQAGLDPQSRVLVRDYIRSLRGRVTVVVTTHDMEEAEKVADRVCIVDRGRLLALDTVDAITGGLGIERLEMRRPTLEDAFIRLTGRGLRE